MRQSFSWCRFSFATLLPGLLVSLFLPVSPANATDELSISLTTATQAGRVNFAVTNRGKATVAVLRDATPFESQILDDLFSVERMIDQRRGGRPIGYTGRIAKRAAPTSADFFMLAPGESVSTQVDLASLYAVPEPGNYRVAYKGEFWIAPPGTIADAGSNLPLRGLRQVEALSPHVRVALDVPLNVLARALPPGYNGCSVAQQDILVEATGAAEGIVAESLGTLQEQPEELRDGAERYVSWFGGYSAERYQSVSQGFQTLLDSLSGETLIYDCTCDDVGLYAYVYSFDAYTLYMCPQFFAAPVLGTDSRAGTIVHELSHFDELLATNDTAYGQAAVTSLAQSSPDEAMRNADSYEYFAENTPFLSMENSISAEALDPGVASLPVDDVSEPVNDFAALPLDTVFSVFLAKSAVDFYRVDEAELVTLTSLTGDADLYVYDDPVLDQNSFVCLSDSFSSANTSDSCELPAGGTFYIRVQAFTDTDYEIVATRTEVPSSPAAVTSTVTPEPLVSTTPINPTPPATQTPANTETPSSATPASTEASVTPATAQTTDPVPRPTADTAMPVAADLPYASDAADVPPIPGNTVTRPAPSTPASESTPAQPIPFATVPDDDASAAMPLLAATDAATDPVVDGADMPSREPLGGSSGDASDSGGGSLGLWFLTGLAIALGGRRGRRFRPSAASCLPR